MRLVKSQEFVLAVVVVLLLAIGAIINPNFMTVANQKANLRDVAILSIAAIGVAFPILTGGIDLSIGSMVGVGGVCVIHILKRN